jgi:hypothetical protein
MRHKHTQKDAKKQTRTWERKKGRGYRQVNLLWVGCSGEASEEAFDLQWG